MSNMVLAWSEPAWFEIRSLENYDVWLWHCVTQLQVKILFPDNPASVLRGIEHAPINTFDEFKTTKLEYWRGKIERDGGYPGLRNLK